MDVKLLKSAILSSAIPDFLIFDTEEPVLSKQYIEFISSTIGKPYKYFQKANDCIYDIETGISDDALYVIYGDKDCLNDADKLSKLISMKKNIVIECTSIPSAFVAKKDKRFSDFVVKFNKLDKNTLLAYAIKKCKDNRCAIEQDRLSKLIDYCDCNLGIMLNELDKIFILEQENSNVLTEFLLTNNLIDYRNVSMFEFINCLLNKDKRAIAMYGKISDTTVSILINTYNMARKRLVSVKNNYYAKIMELCYSLFCGIRDGSVDSSYAIKYLMMKVFR